jgi:hypothetical protein
MEKQQKPTEKEKLAFLKEAALLEVTAITEQIRHISCYFLSLEKKCT